MIIEMKLYLIQTDLKMNEYDMNIVITVLKWPLINSSINVTAALPGLLRIFHY